jgi:hypothetical protein
LWWFLPQGRTICRVLIWSCNLRIFKDFAEIFPMSNLFYSEKIIIGALFMGILCLTTCGREPGAARPPIEISRDAGGDDASVPDQSAAHQEVRPGSYIVMFKSENQNLKSFFATFADEYAGHFGFLSERFLQDSRVRDIDFLTSVDLSAFSDDEWKPDFSMPAAIAGVASGFTPESAMGIMAKVDFTSPGEASEVLKSWESEGRLWYYEPNGISRIQEGELAQWAADYAKLQHWHATVKLPDAFTTLSGGKIASNDAIVAARPVVAVLDSGVDYEHPSLKSNIWTNSAVGAAGCEGDLHGCNTTAPKKGTLGNGEVWPVGADGPGQSCAGGAESKCDHGTHVAGIVAAKYDVATKIGGVCPVCQVMVLRVAQVEGGDTSAEPSISDDSQIRAFKYLTRFKKNGGSAVRVVNASFGKYARSRSLAILVDVLRKVGSGTVVIGAASNEDSMIRTYPAALANAIAVASVGIESDPSSVEKSYFSNYGSWVDVAAPGVAIDSTLSGGTRGQKQGTSMASPVVAGAAGLLLAALPDLSFSELRDRIILSSNANSLYGTDTEGSLVNNQYYYPKVAGEAVRRPLLGNGLLNVDAMVKGVKNSSTGQPLDRVTAGCGVIGNLSTTSEPWLLLLVMSLPVWVGMILVWRRRRD